jgi:hypothetical protein
MRNTFWRVAILCLGCADAIPLTRTGRTIAFEFRPRSRRGAANVRLHFALTMAGTGANGAFSRIDIRKDIGRHFQKERGALLRWNSYRLEQGSIAI